MEKLYSAVNRGDEFIGTRDRNIGVDDPFDELSDACFFQPIFRVDQHFHSFQFLIEPGQHVRGRQPKGVDVCHVDVMK